LVNSLPLEYATALRLTEAARGVFGAVIEYHTETESTNNLAVAAAERGAPEGATFVAAAQSAGRGRLGRTWVSPPGAGLYVSTILRRAVVAPWIALAGGVAVAEAIRSATGLPVQIKWPNDIVAVGSGGFASRRKLAGVLAEAASGTEGVHYVVLGMGINVRPAPLPPEIARIASSLEAELGRSVDPGLLLAHVLAALNRAVADVAAGQSQALLTRWAALAPSSRGARIEWDAGGISRSGLTAGIADDGALLAVTSEGIERIVAGEVRWR
jgi:BirA family transcriptional regulator, biotin operon repressor / biotin---[acetyl-CoA-carboxylase] ligase